LVLFAGIPTANAEEKTTFKASIMIAKKQIPVFELSG
jgi:hypothetical protein